MQQALDTLTSWCSAWKLSLNANKCNTMRLSAHSSSNPHQSSYIIDDVGLPATQSQRDLGVITQCDLSWKEHYNKICRSAYSSLSLIRRTMPPQTTQTVKRKLYLSLVRSHLTYCSPLWRPRLIRDIQSIERVQRRATKYILNNRQADYKSRLISLQLLPLMHWFELQDIMFLVKILQEPSVNPEVYSLIMFTNSVTRAGQSGCSLRGKFNRISSSRHFYFSRIVRLWNALPIGTITLTQSFATIKYHVWDYLKQNFLNNFVVNNTCSWHLKCPCNRCAS